MRRRRANLLVALPLTLSLLGALALAYAFKTEGGRQQVICAAVEQMTGPTPQDPTSRGNLALRGRPFLAKAPAPRAGWHYLSVGPLVVPLPPSDWRRLEPDATAVLLQAESSELSVQVDVYPYRFDDAAARIEAPWWLELLLGDTLGRIKQPIIAAFRRDLAAGCDASKDFRILLLEALLVDVKSVATNSGRAVAARWGRTPSRFALAYESGSTSVVRHTLKVGDDAYVLQYETKSAALARQLVEQLELVPARHVATRPPVALTRLVKQAPQLQLSSFGEATLPTPRELCQEITAGWEIPAAEGRERFVLPFTPGSAELGAEAEAQLRALVAEVERRSSQVALSAVPDRELTEGDTTLLQRAQDGAIRYWLLRNGGVTPAATGADPSLDTSDVVAPAVVAELGPPEPGIDPAVTERLLDGLADALYAPLRDRTTYIRSRRRGDETPIIGLLAPQQRGPAALDLGSLEDRLGARVDRKKLLLVDLGHLPALADMARGGAGLTLDVAQTLRDCMSIDFLLVPVLTSVPTGEPASRALRIDFTVQLIELSTLDHVGSWTTAHPARTRAKARHLLGSVALPFAPGSAALDPEAEARLDHALRVIEAQPGATFKIRGLARLGEVVGPDSAAACTALARARQEAVERHFNASDASTAGSRETADEPACGTLAVHQHALVELWSEREAPFLGISLLD
jgi:hypothetical protein